MNRLQFVDLEDGLFRLRISEQARDRCKAALALEHTRYSSTPPTDLTYLSVSMVQEANKIFQFGRHLARNCSTSAIGGELFSSFELCQNFFETPDIFYVTSLNRFGRMHCSDDERKYPRNASMICVC